MLRFSMAAAGGAAALVTLAGLGAVGCGFVPGLGPWFDARSCLALGFVLGTILG